MVYSVKPELATPGSILEVDSQQTSGETEIFLVPAADGLLVGTGSDHTDREQEAVDVAYSKGLCPKVLSTEVWPYEDILGHFDQLELQSWVTDTAGRRLYQEGRLDSFISVEDVLAEVEKAGHELTNRLIFCGTLPTIGGLSFGTHFEGQLHDPVLGRTLGYSYEVRVG